MKKIYIKVLTKDINPEIITKSIPIAIDKLIIKGSKINETGGVYGYNGFIINISNDSLEQGNIKNNINTIIKNLEIVPNIEILLYLELENNNNLYGTIIDFKLLEYLGKNKISINLI